MICNQWVWPNCHLVAQLGCKVYNDSYSPMGLHHVIVTHRLFSYKLIFRMCPLGRLQFVTLQLQSPKHRMGCEWLVTPLMVLFNSEAT